MEGSLLSTNQTNYEIINDFQSHLLSRNWLNQVFMVGTFRL